MINKNIKNTEPVFPEENGLIIQKILEKYDLIEREEDRIKKMLENKEGDFLKTSQSFPESKTAKLVRLYGERKILLEQLPDLISKELEVDEEKAKEIAKDLKENLLIFIKQVPVEEPTKRKGITIPKRPKGSLGKDLYKEPIE